MEKKTKVRRPPAVAVIEPPTRPNLANEAMELLEKERLATERRDDFFMLTCGLIAFLGLLALFDLLSRG